MSPLGSATRAVRSRVRLPASSVHPLVRAVGRVENAAFDREVRRLLPAIVAAIPGDVLLADDRTVLRVSRTGTRVVMAALGTPEGTPRALIMVAQTDAGARLLDRQATVDEQLHRLPQLAPWARLVPRRLHAGSVGGRTYLVEQALPGTAADPWTWDDAARTAFLSTAAATIRELHTRTARTVEVDQAVIARWARRPLEAVALGLERAGRPGYRARLATIAAAVDRGLRGRTVTVGWIHGDFWPGNLLVDERREITGIVDWDRAAPDELPLHDVLHLLAYTRRRVHGTEPGRLVAELLAGDRWRPWERDLLAGVMPGDGDDGRRAALLLYWIRFAAATMGQSDWYARNPGWVRENLDPVIESA